MAHAQIFLKSNNDRGYVCAVCNVENDLEELLSLGWVKSVDDLEAKPEPEPEPEEQPEEQGLEIEIPELKPKKAAKKKAAKKDK